MTERKMISPVYEHSVPWFWPVAAAIEMEKEGLQLFQDNLKYAAESAKIVSPPSPEWATKNKIIADLDTMRLRDFTKPGASDSVIPVLVDAPFAGHSSTIADYAHGQSLVETLMAHGLDRVMVTDWKSATHEMRDFDIDKYLTDLDTAVDAIGGRVHLVGLCQGGWMSAMYACLHPSKVHSLVLAGSPIDTNAGDGPIKKIAHKLPLSFYRQMVDAGHGLMRGRFMLAGWKDMHPGKQYLGKFVDLYQHIEDKSYILRTEKFERWYENPIDLPGKYYLQCIQFLFQENRFAKGEFVALGHTLSLKAITCPVFLLAGSGDDITTREQVFAAEDLLGTERSAIRKELVPGGHIGLFMGSGTLKNAWPGIASWILSSGEK